VLARVFLAHDSAARLLAENGKASSKWFNSRMVGYPSSAFWAKLNPMPNPKIEKVRDGCAVIQE
jgi:hypothetical protein